MRRRISQAQEELGIRSAAPTDEELERLNQTVGCRRRRVGRALPCRPNMGTRGSAVPTTLNLAELSRTGFYFCKACGRVVTLIEGACEWQPAHTLENRKVEWVPPVG